MTREVVFDLGMVLASPPDLYDRPARLLGVDVAAYEAAYWIDRHAYDQGASDSDYWLPLLSRLGVPGDDEVATLLGALDAELWSQLRTTARDLLVDVAATGRGVSILSNAPFALGDAVEAAGWRPLVNRCFISARLGVTKPDPAIYARVEQELAVQPHEIAFIDDRIANVDAALARGWQAHLWVDDHDTRSWLHQLGVFGD